MPHIDPIPEEAATDAVADLYSNGKSQFGYLPNMHRAFSLRPEYWDAWGALLTAIKANMDTRRYELVTVAAAAELKSSYCALAHGKILADGLMSGSAVAAIVEAPDSDDLTPVDRDIACFARAVVRNASGVTEDDVAPLRAHGLTDAEISDITAAAAVRCFFSKYLDALGFPPDAAYRDLPEDLRKALTVGREIDFG